MKQKTLAIAAALVFFKQIILGQSKLTPSTRRLSPRPITTPTTRLVTMMALGECLAAAMVLRLSRSHSNKNHRNHRLRPSIIIVLVSIIFAVLTLSENSQAQRKALQIGEEVPILSMPNILGNKGEPINLKSYRGKVVLLDFWATYCGACIEGMPNLLALEKSMEDSLIVLPVNGESKAHIQKIWNINPNLKKLPLFTVYEDTELNALFPHELLPHIIWIDRNGSYLGASDLEYVNAQNISRIYEGKGIDWPQKTDTELFDPKTLSLHKYFQVDRKQYFFPFIKGMSGQSGRVIQADSSLRYYVVNTQMANLYAFATNYQGLPYEPKRREVALADQNRYEYLKDYGFSYKWKEKYAFGYERTFPKGTSEAQLRHYILADLNDHFNAVGKIENKEVSVLALRKNGAKANINLKRLKGVRLKNWINGINTIQGLPWVVDESGLGDEFLMPTLPNNMDLASLQNTLQPLGLSLVPSRNILPMFYLKTKP